MALIRWMWIAAIPLAVLLAPLSSWAVQQALVRNRTMQVFEKPEGTSRVLTNLPQGTQVKIADQPRGNWIALMLPQAIGGARFGWVPLSELMILNSDGTGTGVLKPARGAGGKHAWSLGAFGAMALVAPADLQDKAGLESSMVPSIGFGLEFDRRLGSSFWLGARGEMFSLDRAIDELATSYGASFMGGELVARYDFSEGPRTRWGLAVGGGFATGTAKVIPVGSTAEMSGSLSGILVSGRLVFGFSITDRLTLSLEGGYRLLSSTDVLVTSEKGSTLTIPSVNLSAPFGGAGLSYAF